MIPIGDDNPTIRTPIVTIVLLIALVTVWIVVQGGGFDALRLALSICNFGLVPGELTGAAVGELVPIGGGLSCRLNDEPINLVTPLTSMFLHGGWAHLLGNCLFLWVFGNNIEDSMGRLRFVAFYAICGLAAAAAQIAINPASAVPMVGASGAISGVLGAYLVLYPRVRVRMAFIIIIFVKIIPLPAWAVLIWWFAMQVLMGLPQLSPGSEVSAGVAVWAHIGGFVAGFVLVKLFENRALVRDRTTIRHRLHPGAP